MSACIGSRSIKRHSSIDATEVQAVYHCSNRIPHTDAPCLAAAGPRKSGEGVEDEEQGIVSAECTNTG